MAFGEIFYSRITLAAVNGTRGKIAMTHGKWRCSRNATDYKEAVDSRTKVPLSYRRIDAVALRHRVEMRTIVIRHSE